MSFVDVVSTGLSVLTLVSGIAFALFLVELGYRRGMIERLSAPWQFLRRYALVWAFVVATVATAGSLFYSNVAGYEPCVLCWFQRIFMYPQVVLFGLAAWRRDEGMGFYGGVLSLIGLLIAGYHYFFQVSGFDVLSCDTIGYSVSCSQHFFLDFGYITIPMMAFTAFALILVLGSMRRA